MTFKGCEQARQRRPASAGFSLLEVIVCSGILAIAVSGTTAAILSCTYLNERVNHDTLALAAAEDRMAQIRGTPFANIVATFRNQTFDVPGLPRPVGATLPGEVIIIDSETPNEAAYGRNLGVAGGGPGVDLNGNGRTTDVLSGSVFGVDIDGDAGFSLSPEVYTPVVANMNNAKLLPVVVLIRWRSGEGIQRMQLMTTIVNRTP
ncbi:MAG TPA: prepilin-type N-terminal cleavage/methylation domain-containing protein [Planctomycetota bacterium]|nr:prepilin-type N-terminal cleavage/methylation domain-containing protein [Planctomycetota bacterium]